MLKKITIPVHITAGSKDMIKQDHMKSISNQINRSKFTVFSGETHGSYIVNSDKIAKFLLESCIQ